MATGKRLAFFTFLLLIPACSGGPATGTLSGTVTLDGKPVPEGLIRFVPTDGKHQPDDCKIVNGAYSIRMPVGPSKVEIYWLKTDGKVETTATQGTAKYTQMIPEKYNVKSKEVFTIETGDHTKDFALSSK